MKVLAVLALVTAVALWPARTAVGPGLLGLPPQQTDPARGRPVRRVASAVRALRSDRRGQLGGADRRHTREATHRVLAVLDALAPCLEAGLSTVDAARVVAEVGRDRDPNDLAGRLGAAAAAGRSLGQVWLDEARAGAVPLLELLGQAWVISEARGAPLADVARTTGRLLRADVARRRRLDTVTAEARMTIRVLTWLTLTGPFLALVVGVSPSTLYGSTITWCCVFTGIGLLLFGRRWVARLVRSTLSAEEAS